MKVQRYLVTATLTIAVALAACGGESRPPAAAEAPEETATTEATGTTTETNAAPAQTEAAPAQTEAAAPPPAPPPATREPVATTTPAPAPSTTPASTSESAGTSGSAGASGSTSASGSASTTRTAQASSGPSQGELKFNNFCRTCHSVREGDHRLGPSLHGVVGRKAGSAEGFGNYSQAMKSAGFVWDEARLDQFLTNTESVVRGNAMKPFVGIPEADTRATIIEYLKEKGAAAP